MSIQNIGSGSSAAYTSSVSSYSQETVESGSGSTVSSQPEDSLLINILTPSGPSPEVQLDGRQRQRR